MKYGNDPKEFQLKDMNRRITKLEKAVDRVGQRQKRWEDKLIDRIDSIKDWIREHEQVFPKPQFVRKHD